MKLEDMILVTENRKGTETIFLLNFPDYLEMVLKACEGSVIDMADAICQLYGTREGEGGCSELYFRGNISSQAQFCCSNGQLRGFLLGIGEEEANVEKPVFDSSRCSKECFEVLKAYGIGTDGHSLFNSLHYEAVEHVFRQGEILHNLNGSDYRVLAVLSEKNLLLMSQSDGQYIIADNTIMYERSPKEGTQSADSVLRGVEWGHGTYIGHNLMKINLQGIMQEYGTDYEIVTVDECRDEARRQFYLYQCLSKDERLTYAVQWGAEESLRDEFGTTDRMEFETWLQEGRYDFRIKTKEEKRQEEKKAKSR